MFTALRDGALRGPVVRRPDEAGRAEAGRRASRASIIGAAGICLALAGGTLASRTAHAEESFGAAVGNDELVDIRGGDNDTTNSNNVITVAGSEQNTSATNENNSIGGNAGAGNFTIQAGGLNSNSGMTNVVVNTAPQSNTQGIMTLNLVLQ